MNWTCCWLNQRLTNKEIARELGIATETKAAYRLYLNRSQTGRRKPAPSRPGTPTDNPFIEAFNGRFRQECLDQNWFASLDDARTIIAGWREDYNTVQPHTALANLTPTAYKAKWLEQLRLLGNG